jgi:hypothetical protein
MTHAFYKTTGVGACVIAVAIFTRVTAQDSDDVTSTTSDAQRTVETRTVIPQVSVGMTGEIEQLVLPGSELEVTPRTDDAQPLVVRIDEVYPHGTDFRYDMVYYSLEPGKFDLRDVLQRKDGTSAADLPPLPLHVTTLLAQGQVEPHALTMKQSPRFGGYRTLLVVGGLLWGIGLVAIMTYRRRGNEITAELVTRKQTVAEKLRPYVQEALQNRLTSERRAELEMLLLSYWRKKLQLEELRPAESLQKMKADPQAGALLRALEDWLHRPSPPESVDIAELLKPYQ